MSPINKPAATVLFGIWGILAILFAAFIALAVLALLKYVRSKDMRQEKAAIRKSLGETLKQCRIHCNMTQELVAETIGVSRQAVSKWETGAAEPSTSNLIALAKLFNVSVADLLPAAK